MKFGALNNPEEIKKINFSLPKSFFLNKLKIKQKNIKQHVFLGTSVWADRNFLGNLYPLKTPQKQFLNLYSQYFDCIELNTTFYRIPSLKQVLDWKKEVKTNFKFCPKIPKVISHRKDINSQKNILENFLNNISYFDENLGPIFIQLPPYFSIENIDNLLKFIEIIPDCFKLCIEFRHPSWFLKNTQNLFKQIFTKTNISPIITDTPLRRDTIHQIVTTDFVFIRFLANGLENSDQKRLNDWMSTLQNWFQKGVKNVYLMLHHNEKSKSYFLSEYLKNRYLNNFL